MLDIFLITHFPVESDKDPHIIVPDITRINDILLRLPSTIIDRQRGKMNCKVICGTGIRHLETAAALSMSPTYFSPCVGCPDIILSGKKVLLTNGSLVDERDYSCFVDDPDLCRSMIQPLANSGQSSIIITDPYIVRALGGDKPIPGEIFRYVYNATPRTCRI